MSSSTWRTRFVQASLVALFNVFIILYAGGHTDTSLSVTDFGQYYVVGKRLRAGAPIYEPFKSEGVVSLDPGTPPAESGQDNEAVKNVRTANPPPLAVLMWPLAFLPYSVAWWCVCLSSLLIIGALGYRVARELFDAPLERATWLAVSLGSFPTLVNGLLNHAEPFVWAMMTWGWLRLRRGDEKVAGLLLGLAGCLKLFPLAFIPMLLAAGYRRASLFAAASAVIGLAVSAAMVGMDSILMFVREVLPQASRYYFSLGNVSGLSLVARFVSPEVAMLVTVAFLLWSTYLCRRHRSPDKVFVLGVTASLLCSPLSWTYYFIAVLPCVMVATMWLRGSGRALIPFLLVTLVYWPWMLGGFIGEQWMPLPLVLALNYVPTLGLLALWMLPQQD
jgi:hypothetical protein